MFLPWNINFEALGNSQGVEERVANMVTAVETRRCFFGDSFVVFFQVHQTDDFLMNSYGLTGFFFRCGSCLLVKGWGNNSKLGNPPGNTCRSCFSKVLPWEKVKNAWNGYFFGKSLEQFVPKKHKKSHIMGVSENSGVFTPNHPF